VHVRGSFRALIPALAVALCLGAAEARADESGLEGFYGVWLGSAVTESKTETGKEVTARELYVSILESDKGFSMEWAAIRRKGVSATEEDPIVMQVAEFVETERPGVWRSEPSEDPLGGIYAYARLQDGTLYVYNIAVDKAGRLETQIYQRTLSPEGMQLEFRRIVDGVLVRTVKGTLTSSAE